ncbi:hypothetical protein MKZ38_001716 [Zalerion maritima]|uniref:VHS domain-containing protein n=1 Tax=Zalerion maritima TaxID=339359 RepID=A0AAD5RQK7_9PEZI|nr:hypothetical protein MKZ38_001716 [Zalerion maritima]
MFSQKKPFSAVTVAIEDLTSEAYDEEDLSGLPELVESIKLQATGPTEAARAIRKKLKYGNVHRQIRALVILDALIQNAGHRFQTTFADEPLLERLRVCGTSELSHPKVKQKCSELFRGWAGAFGKQPGMERICKLYQELPRRKQVATREKSRAVQESENPFQDDEDEETPHSPPSAAGPSSQKPSAPYGGEVPKVQSFSHVRNNSSSIFGGGSSSSSKKKDKDKKKKKDRRPFNIDEERPKIKGTIADGNIAWSNLMNTVLSTNREQMRISDNEEALRKFEECKKIRRKVLRYIHLVMDEQLLGTLLQLNDDLVKALMTFEQLDRSIDADSDSDDELAEQAHLYKMAQLKGKESLSNPSSPTSPPNEGMVGLSISRSPPSKPTPPPRPSAATKPSLIPTSPPPMPVRPKRTYYSDEESEEEVEDDDNPFADRNAVKT